MALCAMAPWLGFQDVKHCARAAESRRASFDSLLWQIAYTAEPLTAKMYGFWGFDDWNPWIGRAEKSNKVGIPTM